MLIAAVGMFNDTPDKQSHHVMGFILHFVALYVSLGAIEKIETIEYMNRIKELIESGKIKNLKDYKVTVDIKPEELDDKKDSNDNE